MFLLKKYYQSLSFSNGVQIKVPDSKNQVKLNLFKNSRQMIIFFLPKGRVDKDEIYFRQIRKIKMHEDIIEIQKLPLSNTIVIISDTFNLSVYTIKNTLKDNQLELSSIFSQQLLVHNADKYIVCFCTNSYIMVQTSMEQLEIFPYNNLEFSQPQRVLIKIPFVISVFPYNIVNHCEEKDFSLAVLSYNFTENSISFCFSQCIASSKQPIENNRLQLINSLNTQVKRTYITTKGILFWGGSDLYLRKFDTGEFITVMKEISSAPKNIYEFDDSLYFQNGRELVIYNNNQVRVLGEFSLAEKIFVQGNLCFLISHHDDSQILRIEDFKVNQIKKIKNIGQVSQIFSDMSNFYLIAPYSKRSVKIVTNQIWLKKNLEKKELQKQCRFRDNKVVISDQNYTYSVTKEDKLIKSRENQDILSYDLKYSPTSIKIMDQFILVSYWFRAVIDFFDKDNLKLERQLFYNDKFLFELQEYKKQTILDIAVFNNNIIIVLFLDKIAFITLSDIEGQKVIQLQTKARKILEFQEVFFILSSQCLYVISKESLSKNNYHIQQLRLSGVTDLKFQKNVLETLTSTHYSSDVLKVADCQVNQYSVVSLKNNFNFIQKGNDLLFLVQNQILNSKTLQPIASFCNQVSMQTILYYGNQEYVKTKIMGTWHLQNSHTKTCKVFVQDEYSILWLGGQVYDHFKQGFLMVCVFKGNEFINKHTWNLAEKVNDLEIVNYETLWILTEQKAVLIEWCDKKYRQIIDFQYKKDIHLIPKSIQIKGKQILIYDDIKTLILFDFDYNSSFVLKTSRICSQNMNGMNQQIRLFQNYILRTSYGTCIEVYVRIEKKNESHLNLVGYADVGEEITSFSVKEDYIFITTKLGTLFTAKLLNQHQQKLYRDQIDKIAKEILESGQQLQESNIMIDVENLGSKLFLSSNQVDDLIKLIQ